MKEYLISVIKDALLKNDIDYSEIEIEKTILDTHILFDKRIELIV
jgi:hypothetical protein